jgi:hypothetical protein
VEQAVIRSPYWRATTNGEISRPSPFAVFRLMSLMNFGFATSRPVSRREKRKGPGVESNYSGGKNLHTGYRASNRFRAFPNEPQFIKLGCHAFAPGNYARQIRGMDSAAQTKCKSSISLHHHIR